MASEARARKLADRVREIVAEALDLRIKDPRLGFVTVTDARVTSDLREATVFYTVAPCRSRRQRAHLPTSDPPSLAAAAGQRLCARRPRQPDHRAHLRRPVRRGTSPSGDQL